MTTTIHYGDCLKVLRSMPDQSVNCVVTSPPYFGLRDYNVEGQIGLEPSLAEFLSVLVDVFREVRRVLKDDGTCWVNMGDSYAGSWGSQGRQGHGQMASRSVVSARQIAASAKRKNNTGSIRDEGMKAKDMMGVPWRMAFALQDDGWYLRQDIIWAKPNPMPESILDRCTKAHEYIFLLSKSPRYYYDVDAIREQPTSCEINEEKISRTFHDHSEDLANGLRMTKGLKEYCPPGGRNKRSVWTVATAPCKEAHFATFPPKLIEPCILAGCPEGGIVLDPFFGAGTTGLVADRHGRSCIGIELNRDYIDIAQKRLLRDSGMFGQVTIVE